MLNNTKKQSLLNYEDVLIIVSKDVNIDFHSNNVLFIDFSIFLIWDSKQFFTVLEK